MRVAIFRPEPQASRMAERLRAKGVEAIIAPMLVVTSVDDPVTGILAGALPTALLVTSQNAVHALARDSRLGEIVQVPLVAVGSATAEAARLAGFVSVEDARGDGPTAVRLIEARFGAAGGRIVWVAGSERSEALDERLRQIGFTVDVVIAYHAEAQNRLDSDMITALMEGTIDVAVIASARTAESLKAALTDAGLVGRMGATRLVALSEIAARPLAGSFARVEIAERTDGEALIEAVLRSGPENFVREDAEDMSSENEPNASMSETGRRKPKAPIIDLTADDVTPAKAAEAAPDVAEMVDPAPVPTDGEAVSAEATVPSEATPSEPGEAALTDTPAVVADAGADMVSQGVDGSPAEASSSDPFPDVAKDQPADPAPEAVAAAEAEPPKPLSVAPAPRRGFGGYLVAALLGGVVVLGGAFGALRGGYVSLVPDAPAVDLAPLTSEIAAQKSALDAARSEVGNAQGNLDSLAARIEKLEQAPAPAEETAALDALKADVDTLSATVASLPKTAGSGADLTPLIAGLESLKGEVTALSEETAKLKSDLATVAALPATPDLEALKQSLADLTAKVNGLPAPIDPGRLTALESAIPALETKVADLPAFDPNRMDRLEKTAGELDAKITALDSSLKSMLETLATRTGDIEKRLDAGPRGGEIAAVSLGLAALTSKMQAGEPFAGELAVIKAAAPDAAELAALDALSADGAPTAAALLAALPIDQILAARPASTSGGVLDALFSGAQSLVNYRETGDIVEDAAFKALDGIEKALRAGDFAGAEAAASGLPDWGQAAASDWRARLKSRAEAEAALAQLSTRILDRLKAPAEGQ